MDGLPNRIEELRKARGMSLDDLADASGVPRNSINLIERGKAELTVTKMRQIARALDLPPSALLNDEDVELRADAGDAEFLEILREVPASQRPPLLQAAISVANAARKLAETFAGQVLPGDDSQLTMLSELWRGMDHDRRERALSVISAAGLADSPREFVRPDNAPVKPGKSRPR